MPAFLEKSQKRGAQFCTGHFFHTKQLSIKFVIYRVFKLCIFGVNLTLNYFMEMYSYSVFPASLRSATEILGRIFQCFRFGIGKGYFIFDGLPLFHTLCTQYFSTQCTQSFADSSVGKPCCRAAVSRLALQQVLRTLNAKLACAKSIYAGINPV